MRIIRSLAGSGGGGGGGLTSGDVTTLISANSGQPITGPVVTSYNDSRGKIGDYSDDPATHLRWVKVHNSPDAGSWKNILLNTEAEA